MNREQKLRNLILDRYTSLRQFAIEADIPYSTLMTLSRMIALYSRQLITECAEESENTPPTGNTRRPTAGRA